MRKNLQLVLIFFTGVILTVIVFTVLSNMEVSDSYPAYSYKPRYCPGSVSGEAVKYSSTYDSIQSDYVIKNTFVSIYNENVSGAGNAIIKTTYDLEGQVLYSEYNDYTTYQTFDLEVRIPYPKHDTFENYLKQYKIMAWRENAYIVDEQVMNLNSTIQSLKEKISLYVEYYNEADDLNTKLQLLEKIQSLKSQLSYYEKILNETIERTNYVTYRITVSNYKTYKMRSVTIDLTEILYNVKVIYATLFVIVMYMSLTVLPLGVILYVIYKKMRHRRV